MSTTWQLLVPVVVVAALLFSCVPAEVKTVPAAAPVEETGAPNLDAGFWKIWGDGLAEVASYDLTYPRYGEPRRGVAVAIFVTEMFSESARVKADPGRHPKDDEFPVMKLNLVKDFQAGIYDYNDMLSVFVRTAAGKGLPAGAPVKISFSRQEWCGHFYKQVLFTPGRVRITSHSYFDGEADQETQLGRPARNFTDDTLLLWARGMAGPVLKAGETVRIQVLDALDRARGPISPAAYYAGVLSRKPAAEKVAGMDAEIFELAHADGSLAKRVYVEKQFPHRILRWEVTDGEKAELIKTERLKYWEMKDARSAEMLRRLGLSPRPPRTT